MYLCVVNENKYILLFACFISLSEFSVRGLGIA